MGSGPLIHIHKYFRIRQDIQIQSLTDRNIILRQVKKNLKLGEFWNMDVIGLG